MITVVITGSKGFIGKHLVKELKSKTNDIKIIEIDLENGYDITKKEQLQDIKHFDILIHLAAKSYVPDAFINPSDFYYVNIIGTLNVLELCRKYNARMIYTSSYVYGAPDYLPIDEKHPLKAFNPYAQSKLMGEDLCHAYFRDFDISSIIMRPFNIYGEGQGDHFLIQSIINQAKSGMISLKDSRPKRDYIYIDDVVDAYIKAINYKNSGVEIFNLGSGRSTSIKELTDIISFHFNSSFKVVFSEERRKNEVLETLASTVKVKDELKWTPKISINDGVSEIINSCI